MAAKEAIKEKSMIIQKEMLANLFTGTEYCKRKRKKSGVHFCSGKSHRIHSRFGYATCVS